MSTKTEGPFDAYKTDLFQRCLHEAQVEDDGSFRMPLHLDLTAGCALIGNLQLALRHPDNVNESARVARQIIDGLITMMATCGFHAHAEMCRLGDNPDYDVVPVVKKKGDADPS